LDRSHREESEDVTVVQRKGWNAQARGAKVAALGVASSLRGVETGQGKWRWEKKRVRSRETGFDAKEGK
jgi:hypothetical protein